MVLAPWVARPAQAQGVAPAYVVTVTTDESSGSGNAGNCVNTNVSSSGNANCGLRDAVAAANALTGMTPTISFSSSVFSTAQTIQIAQATPITIAQSVTITGPGANLLTIEGGTAEYNGTTQTQNYSIFTINGGSVTLSGMTLAYAYGGIGGSNGGAVSVYGGQLTVNGCTFSGNINGSAGGAIYANAPLTVNSSTFSLNSSVIGTHAGNGGAIYALSTLTVSNSSFSLNSSISGTHSGDGGAIYALSTLTVSSSTFYRNNAGPSGGALSGNATLTVSNSTFYKNYAVAAVAIYSGSMLSVTNSIFDADEGADGSGSGSVTSNGGGSFNSNILYGSDSLSCRGGSGCVNLNEITTNPELDALGSYGGPTQTMLPEGGSSAICAGVAPSVSTDQRGVPISGSRYGQMGCYDIGAVQTEYALTFTTQPSNVVVGSAMFPEPRIRVVEDGVNNVGGAIAVTDADGSLAGSPVNANGEGYFTSLTFNSAETADTLTATYTLTPAITLSATSGTFAVLTTPIPASAVYSTVSVSPSIGPLGKTATVTVTLNDANNNPITGASPSFTSTSYAVVAGHGGYSITYSGNTIQTSMSDSTVETGTFTVTLGGAVSGTLTGSAQFLPLVFVAGSGAMGVQDTAGDLVSTDVAGGGTGAAVRSSGVVWSIGGGNSLVYYLNSGQLENTYTNLGLSGATALAFDGNSNLFVANGNGAVTVVSTPDTVVSTTQGSTSAAASSLAIDNSGNVWIANPTANTVDEIIGGAAPAAPLANAVQNGTPGTEP
jgi:hypothetical protein